MLPYAGQAHAKILDSLDESITDEEWDVIEASAEPIDAKPVPAAFFPGWHGVTELGY